MARISLAALSSHAYTFLDPRDWDARRALSKANFERRTGKPAPADRPEIGLTSLSEDASRYSRIENGLNEIKAAFHAAQPDILIVIGDDQDENFTPDNLPQFAMHVGDEFLIGDSDDARKAAPEFAEQLMVHLVDAGIDIASAKELSGNKLLSHAHYEPLRYLDLPPTVRVINVFVNAIHVPAPTPRRCLDVGRVLGEAVAASGPPDERVAIYSSGGFSHFNPGYPWSHYSGPATLGDISEDFDRLVVDLLRSGDGARLGTLGTEDLLAHGHIELRQHIMLVGAIGGRCPDRFEYAPFYRAVQGMAAGLWRLGE